MSISFDTSSPIVLFGSEAEAISVPVTKDGSWLNQRLDLNSDGEVVRVGLPLACNAGSFFGVKRSYSNALQLNSGVEIRSYLLDSGTEVPAHILKSRVTEIRRPSALYNPRIDLVGSDIKEIPRVISLINDAWDNDSSLEFIASKQIFEGVVASSRLQEKRAHIDLLLLGLETSLWILEQWAVDMRRLFPTLVIVTESSNKVLNYGGHDANGIINAGLPLNITSSTCVLLVSQSGQTFGTLHATRRLAGINHRNIWILTGCLNSKMQTAMEEAYIAKKERYGGDRVINNYSGSRPAEPTSVAIVASMYTLTKISLNWLDFVALSFDKKINKRRGESVADIDVSHLLDSDGNIDQVKESKYENKTFQSESALPVAITRHCIIDIHYLCGKTLDNLSVIVGNDERWRAVESSVNTKLIREGKRMAAHISESWNIMVFAGFYIFFSVGLGLPLWGLVSDAVVRILQVVYGDGFLDGRSLSFSPRDLTTLYGQPWGYTVIGIAIQLIDAVWFIFIGKVATWFFRWLYGRPLWARHGKRTIVIVDNSCVHQLTEMFVSKLFSQAYSFVSVDVHGANGFDHFVHRFTHRVVRGLLLVVGRPDGRLCCLSKSELTLLLSIKQAAFIQNPAYYQFGNTGFGPDIVTVGHNPFESSAGLCSNVVLRSENRGHFVDEILYTKLFESSTPFSGAILKKLSQNFGYAKKKMDLTQRRSSVETALASHNVYGAQFVDLYTTEEDDSLLFEQFLKTLKATIVSQKGKSREEIKNDLKSHHVDPSNNPAIRSAFCSRLDQMSQKIQDAQYLVQYFYESRCASLERYVAFCVMFHAMSIECSSPLLVMPWDVARSQSNLRVATTASPVSAAGESQSEMSRETKKIKRKFLRQSILSHF